MGYVQRSRQMSAAGWAALEYGRSRQMSAAGWAALEYGRSRQMGAAGRCMRARDTRVHRMRARDTRVHRMPQFLLQQLQPSAKKMAPKSFQMIP
jgi:hypothetical protein